MKNAKKETEKRERKTEWSQLEKQKDGSWRKKCKSVIIKDVRLYKKKKKIFFQKRFAYIKKRLYLCS